MYGSARDGRCGNCTACAESIADSNAPRTSSDPRSPTVHALLAATYALTGDAAKAEQYVAKFRQLTAKLSDAQRLAMFGATSKRPEEPHRLLDGVRLALSMSQ